MKNLLFLVHRIPYPPNKGDKIRSYNLLRYLVNGYRVFLGTFVDDPQDWRFVAQVESLCAESCFLPLNPKTAKLRSLRGFLSGRALSLPYYFDSRLQNWVNEVISSNTIDLVLVFSSTMAQYIDVRRFKTRVIDFVDVDSDKWRQYAQGKSWPASWVYQREGRLLFEFEKNTAEQFDLTIFVSEKEADLFKRLASDVSPSVAYIDNGVDTEYFSPLHDLSNPYPEHESVLVFTGAMDYWANVDAVTWFAEEVFGLIRGELKNSRFYIVGSKPTAAVTQLHNLRGVEVAGAVDDIRPYIKFADIAVAPMRIARGVQNKVLEAMAMGKSVLATNAAMEGIKVSSGLDISVTDDPYLMAQMALGVLRKDIHAVFSKKNRQAILDRYSWNRNLIKLGSIMNNGLSTQP